MSSWISSGESKPNAARLPMFSLMMWWPFVLHLLGLLQHGAANVVADVVQLVRFPSRALLLPLIERRIGVEVMDSHAACRTYNILMAEGRNVAAALIIEHRG
jgi:hypothetical protein